MKIINKIIGFIVLLFIVTSCNDDFNTAPDGKIITEDRAKEVVEKMPDRLKGDINGLYSLMKAFPATTGDANSQLDFGMPSIALALEHSGQDCVGNVVGYNWFSGPQSYSSRNYTYRQTRIIWDFFYKQIKMANDILAKVDPKTEDAILKGYLGQAYAIRAYDYFNLVQLFQFTYKGHEQAPAVPIVKEDTPGDVIANNPRAKLEDVYKLILSDLNNAISKLEGVSRENKSVIDQAVAYGIRARVNLVMNKWKEAAADAEKALTLSGESPFSREDVSVPTFDDATAPGVLWGCIITPEDAATKSGICNFTSMFTSLCHGYGGYTTMVNTWKKASVLLYEQIPETDVRKGWWLDENYSSPLLSGNYETDGITKAKSKIGDKYDPKKSPWQQLSMDVYTNVKFAPNNKQIFDKLNATDFPLMRAEEMLLIKAEAKAMSEGVASGKQVLENFVKTYRDPSFSSSAGSPKELQDEIWLQRRIEFWGEGISWFDIMRLKKPVIRKKNGKTNFASLAIFNIPVEAPYMLWPIPISEIQANKGISDTDNNQMGTLPVSE